jgi:NAD(P)-dependent dehydrogenase (short-subunit alcohol dehydrogenase family)
MSKLAGKVAVITGGSSGIGLATAQLFVNEGAHVFITGRRQSELDKAKDLIGKNVTVVQSDVSKLEDLDRLYALIAKEKGNVDIVIANAGIAEFLPTEVVTPEHYDKIFNINVKGAFFTVQKAVPLMKKGGSIVMVSSIAHIMAMPAFSIYCASKAAVRSFTTSFALELKTRNIRVNTLSPGPIDTPIIETNTKSKAEADALKEQFAAMTPMGRMGRSEEIAAAALYLASDDSSFSTGIDLICDGGITELQAG